MFIHRQSHASWREIENDINVTSVTSLTNNGIDSNPVSQFILPPGQLAPRGASQPWLAWPPGGQAVPGYLTPRPGYLYVRGACCPGRFILPPAHTEKILLCDVYYYLQHFNNYRQFLSYKYVNLRWLLQTFSWVSYWQRVGCKLSRAVYLAAPPRISERMDDPQILLHHLLQEYLVERDINFISVDLSCLLQMFRWVMYWQRVGVSCPGRFILPPPPPPGPEFQRELIICKFYYIIYYRNI